MNAKLLAVSVLSLIATAPATAQRWGETEVFTAAFTNEECFGEAVAIEDDRAVVGAPGAFIQFTGSSSNQTTSLSDALEFLVGP